MSEARSNYKGKSEYLRTRFLTELRKSQPAKHKTLMSMHEAIREQWIARGVNLTLECPNMGPASAIELLEKLERYLNNFFEVRSNGRG